MALHQTGLGALEFLLLSASVLNEMTFGYLEGRWRVAQWVPFGVWGPGVNSGKRLMRGQPWLEKVQAGCFLITLKLEAYWQGKSLQLYCVCSYLVLVQVHVEFREGLEGVSCPLLPCKSKNLRSSGFRPYGSLIFSSLRKCHKNSTDCQIQSS